MISERLTVIEEYILGGETWATRCMTFFERLRFFRDTGEWPGMHLEETTALFLQSDIDAERARGKEFCAEKKMKRGKEAGLNLK